MAIKQLTVFVQNQKGSVVSVTDILSKNNINLRALSIAETQDFGILRLIVNDEATAEKVLAEQGYLIKIIDVVGLKIGDAPGKLSEALGVLDKENINVVFNQRFRAEVSEYVYVWNPHFFGNFNTFIGLIKKLHFILFITETGLC